MPETLVAFTSPPPPGAQVRLEQAENRMDLAIVADIKYGVLAELEDTIKAKEAQRPDHPMLPDAVNPDAIAKVRIQREKWLQGLKPTP